MELNRVVNVDARLGLKKEYCEIVEKYIGGASNEDFRRMKRNRPLEAFV